MNKWYCFKNSNISQAILPFNFISRSIVRSDSPWYQLACRWWRHWSQGNRSSRGSVLCTPPATSAWTGRLCQSDAATTCDPLQTTPPNNGRDGAQNREFLPQVTRRKCVHVTNINSFLRGRLHQASASTSQWRLQTWLSLKPHSGATLFVSIYFNKSHVASIIAAFTLTLRVNGASKDVGRKYWILFLLTFVLSILVMTPFVRMATDLLTSEIILTVGRVVLMFCGCGGRIVTGTIPVAQSTDKEVLHTYYSFWVEVSEGLKKDNGTCPSNYSHR